jgi:DNA polymerase (family 10)
MGNRERAFEVFAVASLLEARGANPYRVRAYRRAALRLLRMSEDAAQYLDENGELDLPGLGQRLRRKLGELVRTGHLSFHDELIAAEPRPVRTLMAVPGIGPKTAYRLVGECKVRGLKSLSRAARTGRLQQFRGIGPARERAWGEAADLMLTLAAPSPESPPAPSRDAPLLPPSDASGALVQAALLPELASDAATATPPRDGSPHRAA